MLGSRKGKQQEGEEVDPSTGSGAVAVVREHLQEITGAACESIIGVERIENGWKVRGVVLELERIPPTTDILAAYDVEIDETGEMVKCQRVHRYWRSQALMENGGDGS